ncbi:MAG: bifunctional nicotinamidase/pyrazinamidase [Candidatus Hodarchaeales archaeon]|jgi:nicotinamidase/pyrazinamidase
MEIKDINIVGFIKIVETDVLLIIDMQNDFLPGGALPVEKGDEIISGINSVAARFHQTSNPIIFTQDWHPSNHESFSSVHPGKNPYDLFESQGIGPILWPDHCVQETDGAKLAPGLLYVSNASLILQKGYNKNIDSYSAFLENDRKTDTGLKTFLESMEKQVKRVFICGLALDYCVYFSAMDAKDYSGFDVVVIIDLAKPVNSPENSLSNALETMIGSGIKFTTSENILK